MSKTIVIYHKIDLDGWMSAAIVKKWFEENNKDPYFTTLENINAVNLEPFEEKNNMSFLGWDYGDEIPDLSSYDKVIMVDVAFPLINMDVIASNVKLIQRDFIWIDHHLSAIKECSVEIGDNVNVAGYGGIRDTTFAACELTWIYFFPDEVIPEIVRLLGRYDCFGHKTKSFSYDPNEYTEAEEYLKSVDKLTEFNNNKTSVDGYSLIQYANDVAKRLSEEQKVLEFQYAARARINNYEDAYKHLLSDIPIGEKLNSTLVADMLGEGRTIYQYLCTEARQTYKKAFPIKLFEQNDPNGIHGGHWRFLCVNQERFNPVNFGIDYHKEGYDGFACFWYKDKKWYWSLYNDNGQVDVSVIAKQFDGGGHAGASGFVCNSDTLLQIIK